ncbi:hypothetical protein JW960_05375 [candidate division KSB1 bacterium]|nr:hypothetical protein [candidate division KSB1 bacterium]
MNNKDEKKINPNFKENRWWEFYYVRYFLGMVMGAFILFFLLSKNKLEFANIISTDLKDISLFHLIYLGALGLAYCYISSAPVFVLHVTRYAIIKNYKNKSFSILAVTFALIATLLGIFIKIHLQSFILISSIFLFQIIPVIFLFNNKLQPTHEYYKKLLSKRTKEDALIQKYVESYQHIREHGNAYLIIIFEILFATILYHLQGISIIIILFIWLLPAGLLWSAGVLLEYRLCNDEEL